MSGPRMHAVPVPSGPDRVSAPRTAVVVGGGIAGLAAATILGERGVEVTVLERESYLGGRAGAWDDRTSAGEPFQMERGFHAFFRQYYNLKELLRRIDPDLSFLRPLDDYPIHGPDGEWQSFSGLPRRTPANLVKLVLTSSSIGLRDLLGVDKSRALEMVRYDPARTYAQHDEMSAAEYLDSLRFPPKARRLLFDVFAHSFFNPEEQMSAAELLLMFHFYFTGNPEGLVFDVSRDPFSTTIWGPLEAYLSRNGVTVEKGVEARRVERASDRWTVVGDARSYTADWVVLALPVTSLPDVVAASPDLADEAWRAGVASLQPTAPFAVWRLWLDRPTRPGRSPFIGTTGFGLLDNISLYHLFEEESRAWAERHDGSIVELHAYAVPPEVTEAEIRRSLLAGLHTLYPETVAANVVDERYLLRADCPAFAPGSHADRPTVPTPMDGVTLAGDCIRVPIPTALMERAATSGFMAANHLLASVGVRSEPIRSVPPRGLLA